MDICIVPYQESLRQQVFDFTSNCFNELGKRFEPCGRHSFYAIISQYFVQFWCMLSGGDIIGTVALKRHEDDTAELKALYLAKEFRSKGLGTSLLNKAVDYARESGYKRIVLDSMSQYTAAISLYKKSGFRQIDRFNDNIHADIFMELILKEEQL